MKGAVRIYRLTDTGREATFGLLGRGDCLGEQALLDSLPRSASAVASWKRGLLLSPVKISSIGFANAPLPPLP